MNIPTIDEMIAKHGIDVSAIPSAGDRVRGTKGKSAGTVFVVEANERTGRSYAVSAKGTVCLYVRAEGQTRTGTVWLSDVEAA